MPALDKLLARNLGCSRAEARKLLAKRADCRVGEGGLCPPEPERGKAWKPSQGFHLDDPSGEVAEHAVPFEIDLCGRPVKLYDAFHLMLNKPAGCVTALRDRDHPTALSYLRAAPLFAELRPIGRLDLDSTGLLLWTTDGALLHRLTHPRSAIPRSYHVALARGFDPLPPDLVLRDGHRPKVVDLHAAAEADMHPSLARAPQATVFAGITLGDGAYHEVRRIFAALGSHVLSLCRVSFGPLDLPRDLAPGEWRPVPSQSLPPQKPR